MTDRTALMERYPAYALRSNDVPSGSFFFLTNAKAVEPSIGVGATAIVALKRGELLNLRVHLPLEKRAG
jgi:hypothetical protein